MEKETWEKPELIVINQCRVEENVLAFCNETTDPTCDVNSWEPYTT